MDTLSYEAASTRLDSLKPVDFYEGGGTELYPRQYRNWHVDRCTLWFKDRWLAPSLSEGWLYTKVSLLDLNEHATTLEKQEKAGVGVRLATNGFRNTIMRYSEGRRFPTIIATYYINFGSKQKAERVLRAMRHAIGLCKAQ
jgi:hypothetical protein